MASKSFMYAVYEAVQYEMRQRKDMTWLFELTPAVASNPGTPVINLGFDQLFVQRANLGLVPL